MAKRKREPQWHLYNFMQDQNNSCALTACLQHTRVHIIADADKLDKSTTSGAEYWRLLDNLKRQSDEETSTQQAGERSGDKDSGVDVSEDDAGTHQAEREGQAEDPQSALLSWMLSPILANPDDHRSTERTGKQRTLQDWYHCSTKFYELSISKDGDLEAVELEATKELEKEVDNLLPSVTLPNYVRDSIDTKQYLADDFAVLACSDQPPGTPYHPCRVRHRQTKQTYFFKVVDNSQVRTTKRELDVLGRITNLRLDKQMRVPTLQGLVSFEGATSTESGKCKIMGFLQNEIPDPTPLTNLLDPSIPQAKRDKWAEEAERMKSILHENDIIWGDAKADNFMVDAEDNLWIIDFGGSYTEGWVDPELKETQEGDNMGTDKTVNALHDPVANTQRPEEEESKSQTNKTSKTSRQKRKARDEDDSAPDAPSKRRRSSRLKKS